MELKNFVSSCRNPIITQDTNGNSICVPCGHCADCNNKRAVRYTGMAINASQEHRYTYMITLKYDEVNVPRMYLKEVDDMIYCIDITKRPMKTKGKFKKLKTYGQVIHSFPKDEHFDEFYKKADIYSKMVAKKPFKNLRWCCAEDFQNFIKRLRFRFSQVLDSSFSFFAVSEYGPQTFRPHFHVLLFFDDWRMFKYLREFIIKSWKFGSLRTESPDTNEGVCSYVASYLNSTSHLPHYLNSKLTRPRSFHSQFLGAKATAEIRDYVYNADGFAFDKVDISTSFGTRPVIFTSDLVRTLFPRCYNFSAQTPAGCVKLYSIYRELSQRYGVTNINQLTKEVIFDPDTNHDFLYLLDVFDLSLYNREFYDFYELGIFKSFDSLPEQLVTIYNRIYSSILLSRHVYQFCLAKCESFLNFLGIDSYNLMWRFVDYVKSFYDARDKWLFKQQYIMQDEYGKQCPPPCPKSFDGFSFFDILHFIPFYERVVDEHFRIFYPIGTLDYQDRYYKNNPYIKTINFEKDKCYSEKVKHKELNDVNLIFVE